MKTQEKKFFITDPCYIMGDDYVRVGKATKWNMERAEYPIKCKNGVIVHKILPTPSGDGSYDTRRGTIGVDSGQLCLAEVPENILKAEMLGVEVSSDSWEQTRKLYFYLSKF